MTTRRSFLRNSLVAVGTALVAPVALATPKAVEAAPPPPPPAPASPFTRADFVLPSTPNRMQYLIGLRQQGIVSTEYLMRELGPLPFEGVVSLPIRELNGDELFRALHEATRVAGAWPHALELSAANHTNFGNLTGSLNELRYFGIPLVVLPRFSDRHIQFRWNAKSPASFGWRG